MEIRHDPEASRFWVEVEGEEAELAYHRVDGTTLDFEHTFVPEVARGRGIADRLVDEAFRYARENRFQVVPSCSYVARKVVRKPEYQELVKG